MPKIWAIYNIKNKGLATNARKFMENQFEAKMINCYLDFFECIEKKEGIIDHQDFGDLYYIGYPQSREPMAHFLLSKTGEFSDQDFEQVVHYLKGKTDGVLIKLDSSNLPMERLGKYNIKKAHTSVCVQTQVSRFPDVKPQQNVREVQDYKQFSELFSICFQSTFQTAEVFAEAFYNNPNFEIKNFFVYDGAVAVGFGSLVVMPGELRPVLFVGAGVLDDFRGKGHYRALLEHRLNYCRENNLEDILIDADITTSYSSALKFGFQSLNEGFDHFTYEF